MPSSISHPRPRPVDVGLRAGRAQAPDRSASRAFRAVAFSYPSLQGSMAITCAVSSTLRVRRRRTSCISSATVSAASSSCARLQIDRRSAARSGSVARPAVPGHRGRARRRAAVPFGKAILGAAIHEECIECAAARMVRTARRRHDRRLDGLGPRAFVRQSRYAITMAPCSSKRRSCPARKITSCCTRRTQRCCFRRSGGAGGALSGEGTFRR